MDEGIFPTVHFWMNFHTKNSKTNLPATNTLSWKLEVLRVTLNFSQFRIQAPYSLCTVSPQTEDQPKPSILKLLKVSWNRLYYKKIHTFNWSDHFLKILLKKSPQNRVLDGGNTKIQISRIFFTDNKN